MCHLGGRFYGSLGKHVQRTHRLGPGDYRELIRLSRHASLTAPVTAARMAELRRATYSTKSLNRQ
jgi:predicted transcriptional regulator